MLVPFSSIVFGDRFRQRYIDIGELADSIIAVGLIQPLVIDTTHRLLAGGRRHTAISQLIADGRLAPDYEVPVHVRSDLNGTELDEPLAREIELEENLQRNDMTWQENVLSVAEIHGLKARRARAAGDEWSHAQTGKLFGQSRSNVDNAMKIAAALRAGDAEVAAAEHASAALMILTTRRVREVERVRAARMAAHSAAAAVAAAKPTTVAVDDSAASVPALATERVTRFDDACRRVQLVECGIAHMRSMLAYSLDGVYCDPPYGIDDENFSIKHIESTRAEHNRDANIALFEPLLDATYHVLRPESYAVFWCDPEHFTTQLRIAERLGFRTQRWPLIAKKPIAANNAAAFNTTKDYETLLVLSKTNATLATRCPTSFVPWTWQRGEAERYVHPFAKPHAAHEHVLRTYWQPGARIHDPTCGEASGVLAGLRLGYDMTGTDIVEDHVLRARRHIETR